MKFSFFGFSDIGKARNQNQDNYLCNEDERLFLVADGIGGHASGETASLLAVKSVEEFIIRSRSQPGKRLKQLRRGLTPEQNRLLAGVVFANQKIMAEAKKDSSKKGMGTTLIGVLMEKEHLAVAHVGDSRLYCVRNNVISQITEDHTLIGEQKRKGLLSESDAKQHPQRHILTSALGINEKPKIDVTRVEIFPEDLFLICSDGLYHMLDDIKILSLITSIEDRSLYKIGLSLVLEANLAGGEDNITVVLLSF